MLLVQADVMYVVVSMANVIVGTGQGSLCYRTAQHSTAQEMYMP